MDDTYDLIKKSIINNDLEALKQCLDIVTEGKSQPYTRAYLFANYGLESNNDKIIRAFLDKDYIQFEFMRTTVIYYTMMLDTTPKEECVSCRSSIYGNNPWHGHRTKKELEDLTIVLLKDSRAKIDEKFKSYIETASLYNHTRVCEYILENISDINSKIVTLTKSSVMEYACDNGNVTIFKMLLNVGVDPTYSSRYIYIASGEGATEIVKILLSYPSLKAGIYNSKALYDACIYKHSDTALLLIADERIDCSAKNNRALKTALTKKLTDVVKVLYKNDNVKISIDDTLKNKVDKYLSES